MSAPRVRADYDAIARIATQFEHEAAAVRLTLQGLRRLKQVLQAGDWIGEGARAFYAEMDSQVLPGLERLAGSLEAAAHTMRQIGQLVHQLEETTARILGRIGHSRPVVLEGIVAGVAAGAAAVGARRGCRRSRWSRQRRPGSAGAAGRLTDAQIDDLRQRYDGNSYDAAVANERRAQLVTPPVSNGAAQRDARLYDVVLNQFGVESNPRYTPDATHTYCNIYAWDATRAMNAEIPHWVDESGNPTAPGHGHELNVNSTVGWMRDHGGDHGWRAITAAEAQTAANGGHPAVVLWQNPGGHGHIAMVRPGTYSAANGPEIAQAGRNNLNRTTVRGTFGQNWGTMPLLYYTHD